VSSWSPWSEWLLAVAAGPALWLAGAIFFDFVHWVLHGMLRSRWSLLRALAWPHSIHHQWIDRELRVRWEYQRRNVWCHIVPEYATQLAFTGALTLLLPLPFVVVLAALQTAVFAGILRAGGLDTNHRPVEFLDAYRPGFLTPPAYHALHHVHPDAYFSAYTKLVDMLVGGAFAFRGRRFALRGATGFGQALQKELTREGVQFADPGTADHAEALSDLDVLVLCDPDESVISQVEALAAATRDRVLPPEVWAIHTRANEATARHYFRDVRVGYRSILLSDRASPSRAQPAARAALFFIRHGFHLVPTQWSPRILKSFLRFRATRPVRPKGAPRVHHRADLSGAAPESG
jgi:hypothetical protein